ncbi:carboxypeptidase-like regulatory domain-containing protein [Polaribacter porphyrae]|uniref:Uncharacterized protein n=1 Tax=Polaribacter porphyrae TaxID=1137780 RepID=A0A2S7WKK9_9FLAO|nr:carboxypeptidase-like regulatory domain-containing protein [Polaribacter porphyrae]PQJ77832.1 hypothetical protein BTO18_00920 [Polaribacter porphyrae]
MTNKLILFLFLIPIYFFAQAPQNLDYKTVSGFINYKNKPLENVSIFVKNTIRFSVSDTKGSYKIKVKVGETLSFSYVGLEKIEVLIEDVTSILNIDLKIRNTITQIQSGKVIKLGETNIGEYKDISLITKIKGSELNENGLSITKAIQKKAPFLLIRYNDYGEEITYIKGKEMNGPVVWVIDNVSFDIPFDIFILEVKEVLIFNYDKKRPVITVNTNIDYKKVNDIDFANYYFNDSDYYNHDAISYKKVRINYPFLDKYKRLKPKEAFDLYKKTNAVDKNITNFYFTLFNTYKKKKDSKPFLLNILSDFESMSFDNPEDLKAIAYKYLEINEKQKALEIYKKLVKLRPKHHQSYRDLANAFLGSKKYRNVWLTYRYFFKKGFKIDDNDIGEIITSEIVSTYNLDSIDRTNLPKIKIENSYKNIARDVRIVFEWNTTEAEFIIEFVNPNLDVFEIENSLVQNQGLIEDQKKKGYTSKEIFINQLNYGNYLVNLTYLGNKQYKPTVFKITTYYNWGRPNQTKKTAIFDFIQKDKKFQLLKLNRRFLR